MYCWCLLLLCVYIAQLSKFKNQKRRWSVKDAIKGILKGKTLYTVMIVTFARKVMTIIVVLWECALLILIISTSYSTLPIWVYIWALLVWPLLSFKHTDNQISTQHLMGVWMFHFLALLVCFLSCLPLLYSLWLFVCVMQGLRVRMIGIRGGLMLFKMKNRDNIVVKVLVTTFLGYLKANILLRGFVQLEGIYNKINIFL